jgi:hypothetical protein
MDAGFHTPESGNRTKLHITCEAVGCTVECGTYGGLPLTAAAESTAWMAEAV